MNYNLEKTELYKPIIREVKSKGEFVVRYTPLHYLGTPLIEFWWQKLIQLTPNMEQSTTYRASISAFMRDEFDTHLRKVFELQYLFC